jgi:hypothetical protein
VRVGRLDAVVHGVAELGSPGHGGARTGAIVALRLRNEDGLVAAAAAVHRQPGRVVDIEDIEAGRPVERTGAALDMLALRLEHSVG